jgi:hypothetical protein
MHLHRCIKFKKYKFSSNKINIYNIKEKCKLDYHRWEILSGCVIQSVS